MKTSLFMSFSFLVAGVTMVSAQTPDAPSAPATNPPAFVAPPPPPLSATNPSPTAPAPPAVLDVPQPQQPGKSPVHAVDAARLPEFEQRFAQGKALEDAGKLVEARAVFDGIIAEAPEAKGSLREAGIISVRLNDLPKANDYFSKLHALVPDYPAAIESLIQINEALKHDVKVEILLKEFHQLAAKGKVPNPYFVRERIHLDDGSEIVMTEYFDYTKPPYTIWMAEKFSAQGERTRWLLLNYDPDATKAIRTKDEKMAKAEIFTLFEHILSSDGRVKEIAAYQEYIALPGYPRARAIILATMANPPKPIYSATVPATQ